MFFNRIKTVFLLAALSGLLLLLGNLFGGAQGMTFALILALIMNAILYFFSDRIVLSVYGAQPLDQHEYPWIYEIVTELAQTMRIPMPKLWLIRTPMANAFATGRSPQHASVAVTTGILQLLDRHELRGVLAHELAHVKNRDILVATIAATMATAIGYLANMLHHLAFWESVRGDKDRKSGNPIVLILVTILMPIAATLIQLAISRSREYLADETGAHECHDPLALASALEKLHHHIPQAHLNPENDAQAGTASLFIVHPFNSSKALSWFSTHPPLKSRIERLQKIFERQVKSGENF
jgi:heat shock protein HtpX